MRYPLAPEFAKLAILASLPLTRPALKIAQAMPTPRCRPLPGQRVTRHDLTGHEGGSFRTWLIEPEDACEPLPCIIYFHGGGFMMPIQPYMFGLARRWAAELGCKALVVQYRLAPFHPFPTAAEDAHASFRWLIEHADELGIDAGRIAVAGDSAGGNLAIATCLMARDRGGTLPCFQLLLYPTTDRRLETESCRAFQDTPVWSTPLSKIMWEHYLGTSDEATIQSMEGLAYASPLEAASLEGLPDAYVEVCEFDCLRDEGLAYAETLERTGAQVEVHQIDGAPHGADLAGPSGPIMREVAKWRLDALARAL